MRPLCGDWETRAIVATLIAMPRWAVEWPELAGDRL